MISSFFVCFSLLEAEDIANCAHRPHQGVAAEQDKLTGGPHLRKQMSKLHWLNECILYRFCL